ncbi:hypothetical protein B0O99DRAFT_688614 [Bisporella sp. PMI_857]|nr:hypothetical protein B0O99DRAFT_688614 [Bisporella sp. PMI_857]
MESHNRRRSSIDRVSIESILAAGDSSQPSPVPNAHVGASPNKIHFPMAPPPTPPARHARSVSHTPRPNRLSLNFPVATGTSDSTRPTPTSTTTASFPSFPPTPQEASPSPTDPSGFLVAIATQERRVLELKEELQKAESGLAQLKVQWANQERTKKRAEHRRAEPLLSLQNGGTDGKRLSEEGTRQSIENERRKALLAISSPRESRRKIITGGHARTLSLLSPERSNFNRPFPAVQESSDPNGLPRSTTMPDTSQGLTKITASRARHSYQSGLTHGAKQVAEDLKAGMWTFLEDLRQATVGDEAVNGSISQYVTHGSHSALTKKTSKGSLKSRHTPSPKTLNSPRTWDTLTHPNIGLGLADPSGPLWLPENSRRVSKAPTGTKPKRPLSFAPAVAETDDDDWSNWDSPTPKSPRWSGSTDVSNPATPVNNNGEEDRTVKILDQNNEGSSTPSKRGDEIQWPALDKLTPGNLKRSMSTLMKEWEKSLSPPTGEQPASFDKLNAPEKTDQERSISQMPLL